ncbi:MAG TPA: GNAT family N-acetyltransferase [Bacteroidia bacterium]|nr:GNAT family N-acetyltransferase [Bacteroidia bacterium]
MKMFPESTRLRINALSVEEIHLYLKEDFSFETALGLEHYHSPIPPPLRTAIEERILPKLLAFPQQHLFYTQWNVVDKTINTTVAGIVFKGPPNHEGSVEIGYGTLPDFTGKGYMKETVQVACQWAFAQQGVKKVTADTSPDNIASQKILEHNGFVKVREDEEFFYWELTR